MTNTASSNCHSAAQPCSSTRSCTRLLWRGLTLSQLVLICLARGSQVATVLLLQCHDPTACSGWGSLNVAEPHPNRRGFHRALGGIAADLASNQILTRLIKTPLFASSFWRASTPIYKWATPHVPAPPAQPHKQPRGVQPETWRLFWSVLTITNNRKGLHAITSKTQNTAGACLLSWGSCLGLYVAHGRWTCTHHAGSPCAWEDGGASSRSTAVVPHSSLLPQHRGHCHSCTRGHGDDKLTRHQFSRRAAPLWRFRASATCPPQGAAPKLWRGARRASQPGLHQLNPSRRLPAPQPADWHHGGNISLGRFSLSPSGSRSSRPVRSSQNPAVSQMCCTTDTTPSLQPRKIGVVGEEQEKQKQRGPWMCLRHLLALTTGHALQIPYGTLGRREVSPCQAVTVIFSLEINSLYNQQYKKSFSSEGIFSCRRASSLSVTARGLKLTMKWSSSN